jgi:CSLREA domain-containing protein
MKAKLLFALLIFAALIASCAPLPTFVVNSNGDDPDADPNDGVCATANSVCTLRAAILEATALNSPTGSIINFQGVTVINVTSPLPHLTTGGIRIRGEGKVTLDGGQDGECDGLDGLVIEGSNSNAILGLAITGFNNAILIDGNKESASLNLIGDANATGRNILGGNCHGIYIQGQFAGDNWVKGNYIGATATGAAADPNEIGIVLISDTHDNIIGNLTASAVPANVISGNTIGIQIFDSDSNKISGNYIGTTKAGTVALGNGTGINLNPDSNGNAIGQDGSGKGSGNVISGNLGPGIEINSSNNIVSGNFIGTTNTGMAALGNGSYGIHIAIGSGNIIGTNGNGTADDQEGNVISANGALIAYSGLEIEGNNNVVAGNFIGTIKDGTAALGNKGRGVYISGDANRVGTDSNGISDVDETNVISGNANEGIYITSAFNIIAGNRIGTDAAGTIALGNKTDGISIAPSGHFNVIGINGVALPHATGRNVISANGAGGGNYANVHIEGDYNMVSGNYIGPNSTGSASLGNTLYGVQLSNGATGNIIGTNGDGSADGLERNLISGNGYAGVRIFEAFDNMVAGNYIGTNAIGLSALPNALNSTNYGGVYISDGSTGNVIGTNGDGSGDGSEGNVISGNDGHGVEVNGTGADSNVIAGNHIGTDKTGTAGLPNTGQGINIASGPIGTRVGTNVDGVSDALEANVISANGGSGVWILIGDNTQIAGNFIGTDKTGTASLGNNGDGVHLDGSNTGTTNNNDVGGSVEKMNVIAFNQQDGIEVMGYSVYPLSSAFTFNSIFDNEGLGINLGFVDSSFPVTFNDPGDGDIGGNDLLNFPELNTAVASNISIAITGQIIDGLPNKSMLIQFFSNVSCDPSNYGEGQTYIGQKTISTNASGDASFFCEF